MLGFAVAVVLAALLSPAVAVSGAVVGMGELSEKKNNNLYPDLAYFIIL